jgi:formylglycine-generating enzyme required for sulfatase activity
MNNFEIIRYLKNNEIKASFRFAWLARLFIFGALLLGCKHDNDDPQAGDSKTIEIADGVTMEVVWCPAGTFSMGSPDSEQERDSNETLHYVTLSQGFWIGRYEVTKEQWRAVKGATPWEGQDDVLDEDDSPATYVSWNDCSAFVSDLNDATGLSFAIPTEAQWEYACRAGTETRFYWGDDSEYSIMDDYAWFYDNAEGPGAAYAHNVALKSPNPWGLYDMIGNISEWCSDWYKDDLGDGDEVDPDGPKKGTEKLQRGGSWSSYGNNCRAANRTHKAPDQANVRYGLRVVLSS